MDLFDKMPCSLKSYSPPDYDITGNSINIVRFRQKIKNNKRNGKGFRIQDFDASAKEASHLLFINAKQGLKLEGKEV